MVSTKFIKGGSGAQIYSNLNQEPLFNVQQYKFHLCLVEVVFKRKMVQERVVTHYTLLNVSVCRRRC